jgi:hypothetical protein
MTMCPLEQDTERDLGESVQVAEQAREPKANGKHLSTADKFIRWTSSM